MKGAGFVPPTFGNYDDLTLDSCFHLLRLYCARDHSLEQSLDPATSVPFHLDYRIRYVSLKDISLCALVSLAYKIDIIIHLRTVVYTSFSLPLQLAPVECSPFSLLHPPPPVVSLPPPPQLLVAAGVSGSVALGRLRPPPPPSPCCQGGVRQSRHDERVFCQ